MSIFAAVHANAQATYCPALDKAPPREAVRQAAQNELGIIDVDGNFPLRYLIRKKDAKGDMMRDVIESRDGTVARLVQRDGRPLTADEDTAERQRLEDLLNNPKDFAKHAKHDLETRKLSKQLVSELPDSMDFVWVAGQPQLPGRGPQAVVDFDPAPGYKPPAMKDNVLTGIAGRVWIDCTARRVSRIEARILHTIDFGYGMLARIYPGGTLEFEQTGVSADRWVYSKLRENLTLRAVLFKTLRETSSTDTANFQLLPAPVSYSDAIRTLLATPLPK